MKTVTSQHPSSLSPPSFLPPQIPVEAYIGSFVTLIANFDIRYEGILCFLNLQESTLGLQNVVCYGTEGRNQNGVQIPPDTKIQNYILFNGNNIKEIIVQPPTWGLARGSTCSKSCLAPNPPLPIIVSPNNRSDDKILQQFPLISNENLIQPQAKTESNAFSVNGSVNDRFPIASQPQFPSYFYDPYVYQSMPYAELSQAPIWTNIMHDSSAFKNSVRYDFEAMTKNAKQYNIWGPSQTKEEESSKPTYNIDGSSYKISRTPFEPIGRP
ncbi:putative protein [Arabidopsis thaliana]|uniref:SCD6 protein-like protein n=1 Tax=Arabidopsis thaliana TaxID=3702 RepID=O65707_ARATH|nr:SCD6 protein-like protein [Arabidopsis thaliana]AEE84171.1 SCD6 protein-like protein [Arabidopsis thaliana]CAA18623.1 putative protein [Arabidopsis thaliana]CAB78938.1 putative protein [Arabidopsis thaliana]|eukprot:NP_193671.1 SCD6 protein-like protein [Arabidopsis thaliana]